MAYGYTLLESTQIVEGKCTHDGKLLDHEEVISKGDPCESYRCDAQRKMMLVNLCHYGLNQKAPPGCVLRKRPGDFPACCPWPDCSDANNTGGTTTDKPLTDATDLPATADNLHETPAATTEPSLDELSSTVSSASALSDSVH
ncbi:hypothetical protein MTO96_019624 [Rhipicephalus appendiculatus]